MQRLCVWHPMWPQHWPRVELKQQPRWCEKTDSYQLNVWSLTEICPVLYHLLYTANPLPPPSRLLLVSVCPDSLIAAHRHVGVRDELINIHKGQDAALPVPPAQRLYASHKDGREISLVSRDPLSQSSFAVLVPVPPVFPLFRKTISVFLRFSSWSIVYDF